MHFGQMVGGHAQFIGILLAQTPAATRSSFALWCAPGTVQLKSGATLKLRMRRNCFHLLQLLR